MAEAVQLRSEGTIPELEAMLVQLFSKDEVQTLKNMREEYEFKIRRVTKRKDDFIKYINFETQFLRMLKLRYKKKGLQRNAKLSHIEYAIGKRLNKLYVLAIRSFSRDLRLWLAYIKFCQKTGNGSTASRVLEQLLDQHGHSKPELYKLAAKIELDNHQNIEKARKYLLMGIHVHKDNKSLLTEAFRLELIDANKKRKELEDKNLPIDATNDHLNAKKAENIYKNAIRKMEDVELLNDLIDICQEFDFANELKDKIQTHLFAHENDERMWDIFYTRFLLNDEKATARDKVKRCMEWYEKAIEKLNTTKMWAYYLDALIELSKDTSALKNYKRRMLLSALQKAATAGKLTEKYYLLWVNCLQGPEKHKKLVEVLQGAVEKLPNSVTLWHTLLKTHLTKGEEKPAQQVFDQGVAALTTHSLPLWKLMLQFEQIKRNNKVEELFTKSWSQCPEIAEPLKLMYLEWLVLSQGIVAARKVYATLCDIRPHSLDMHKKMIYLESIQPTMNKKKMRECYIKSCELFGSTNIDVWIDHFKFEVNNDGDPEQINKIYRRAHEGLSEELFDTLQSEMNIIFAQSPHGIKDIKFKSKP